MKDELTTTTTTTTTTVTMRAAMYRSFGGPIRIEQVPVPVTPRNGVVVQVMATGVCRSDWHGWKGHDDDIHHHGLPFCPGHELSGIVTQVGQECHNFRVGDRVAVPFILSCGQCYYCCNDNSTVCTNQQQPGFTQWGSFAEFVALPRADRNLRKLPSKVSFVQAAALGCRFTTAYRAVMQQGQLLYQLKKKKKKKKKKQKNAVSIAIFGCGGLGLSCIMIAAAAAANAAATGKEVTPTIIIIAIDVSPRALEKAKELGATHIVQASSSSSTSIITTSSSSSSDEKNKANKEEKESNHHVRQQVLEITKGHGVDISIDAAGFPSTCENAVHCTKRGGRMIQVGLPIGNDDDDVVKPSIPMGLVVARELELVGSHGFAAADLPDLLQLVADGTIDPSQLVEKECTLEEGARALEDMDHGSPLGITVITQFQSSSSPNNSRL
jgi:alcohol dehydrogenase